LERIRPESSITLPCTHTFHGYCVQGIRRFGVLQACPLCGAELPPDHEKMFKEAARRYCALVRRQQLSGHAWQNMKNVDRKEAREIAELLRHAGEEGSIPAKVILGIMHAYGQLGTTELRHKDDTEHWSRYRFFSGPYSAPIAPPNEVPTELFTVVPLSTWFQDVSVPVVIVILFFCLLLVPLVKPEWSVLNNSRVCSLSLWASLYR